MDLTPYVQGVRADLEAVAGSDESSSAIADRIGRALEPSLQLRLLDALGQAAQELSEQLPMGRIDVRLAGRDVQLAYAGEEPAPEAAAPDEGSGTARITLRMPDALKARVEDRANRDGVSVNTWLVRAASRAIETQRRSGRRITGMAQS
ncbi:MAG: histidine kinase [Actinomycetota bacterium]